MNDKDNPTDKEIADALRGLDPDPNTLMRNFDIEFAHIRCITCDIHFYVPKFWQDRRRENLNAFYCPNGHSMRYKENG